MNRERDAYGCISLEDGIPASHSLRLLKAIIDSVLRSMSKKFDNLNLKLRVRVCSSKCGDTFWQVLDGIGSERLVVNNWLLIF